MVLDYEILPVWQWLVLNLQPFLVTLAALFALGVLGGFLLAALRHGPGRAAKMTFETLATAGRELSQLSARRIFAMAKLAFQESIRRRVLVVIVLFLVILSFAAWFLNRNSDHPARLYLSVVMTAANYLVIPLAIFLSTLSLPNDMKNRTIYTVVTKPVRTWELLLGRMLGFCAIGTLILLVMCLFSYVFVKRGLHHDHAIDPQQLITETTEVDGQQLTVRRGRTSLSANHRHEIEIGPDGQVRVQGTHDHSHHLSDPAAATGSDPIALGPPTGLLEAKVPVRGSLRFLSRTGQPSEQGVSVGYESKYRSYIEGGTLAAAIWTFDGVTPERFPAGLPVEMTIRVFRSYQGDIERGILGTLELVKPAPRDADGNPTALDGGLRSVELSFTAKDQGAQKIPVPRKLDIREPDGTIRSGDLFELVDEQGRVEIWIRNAERHQYFGMAPADLYLHAADRPFSINLAKGFASIWFQMVVVTCFGVAFSTFLSGPVAMLATLSAMVVGYNKSFVGDVVTGDAPGGGPLESLVRLLKQDNLMVELEPGLQTTIIQQIDFVVMRVIYAVTQALPNGGQFNTSNFVAYGFDVPGPLVIQHLLITLAYALAVAAAGYFLFKTREVAA